jgi:protein-tyrosine phosphatase
MAELITGSGGVPTPFAARQLERAYIGQADLVLVMTRAHRSAVVALEPAAVRRTFLFPELAAIASAVAAAGWPSDVGEEPAARLAALPLLAAPYRAGLADRTDLEVPDPYRQPAGPYLAAFERISGAVDSLLMAIGGAGAR